jgi:integrase
MRWAMAQQWGRILWRNDGGLKRPYLDFRPHGRVYSTPAGMPLRTKVQAAHLLRDIRAAYAHGALTKDAILARYISGTTPRLTVGAKYRKWVAYQAERVASGDLSQEYLQELIRYGQEPTEKRAPGYLLPLFGRRIDTLRTGDLKDLEMDLARRGLSPKTRSHVLAALKTFYHWLVERDELATVPRFPKVRVTREIRATLSVEDQRAVLDAIDERKRGVFLALAYHGIRPKEALRLDVADYDFTLGVIAIRARKAKTKEAALIQASDELRAWIASRVRPELRLKRAALFLNPLARTAHRRWSIDTLENVWNAAERRAGVRHVGLYAGTKHTSATEALRRGASLEQIKAALRHADVRSTELYAQAAQLAPVSLLTAPVLPLRNDDGEKQA